MVYGKLICGYLVSVSQQEGKPVVFTPQPIASDGYEYVPSWSETGDTITQVWTLVEHDLTNDEILAILLGEGDEE